MYSTSSSLIFKAWSSAGSTEEESEENEAEEESDEEEAVFARVSSMLKGFVSFNEAEEESDERAGREGSGVSFMMSESCEESGSLNKPRFCRSVKSSTSTPFSFLNNAMFIRGRTFI